jgi:hypothetical protein
MNCSSKKGGKNMKKILIAAIVILGLYFMTANAVADPVVDSVTTDPAAPAHQATVTVTAEITGDDVTAVSVVVKECRSLEAGGELAGVCFINTLYNMTKTPDGKWEVTATLKDESGLSDYIDFEFDITDSGEEYQRITSEEWPVDLDLTTEPTGNGGDSNGDSDGGSPGFEVITLLAAIVIGILLIKRKR